MIYPCMNIDCDKESAYIVTYSNGTGGTVCEDHLEKAKSLIEAAIVYPIDEEGPTHNE